MKKFRLTLSYMRAYKLKKGEKIILQTSDKSHKTTKDFIVQILEIKEDVPRCCGCSIRLDNKKTYKYKDEAYCFDCYKRRIS